MRGTILDFDPRTATGIISGDDQARYAFKGSDVNGDFGAVRQGTTVDFTVADNQAVSIYPIAAAQGSYGAPAGAQKNKIAAGLLALFVGGLGIHKFYLGNTGAGLIMLLCSLFGAILLFIPTFVIGIIALIEGIIYLTKSDEDFYKTYEANKKAWF